MIYAMSDIHGDYERYKAMLEKIRFSDHDTLYVLGDVIDRGDGGVQILQDMMMRPNVIPIKGNHEYMMEVCMEFLMQEVTEESVENIDPELMQGLTEWMNVGASPTINEFYRLDGESREMILQYLEEFSLYEIVKAGGRVFILVHAGLANFSPERELDSYHFSELLFHCPNYEKVYFEKAYLVTGHLPTDAIWESLHGELTRTQPASECRYDILEVNNHIAIDCGCGYGGQLGCICLDTMEKYYV